MDNEMDVVDLLEVLAQDTEHKAPPGEKTAQNVSSDVFHERTRDDESYEETDSENLSDTESDFEGEPEEGDADVQNVVRDAKKLKVSGKKLAPVIVKSMEAMMNFGFPLLYQQRMDADDRVALKSLSAKYRHAKEQSTKRSFDLTEEDQRIMEIYLDYENYCESLPLDKEERESLIEPLAELLPTLSAIETPEGALLAAVFAILASRAMPLIFKPGED